MESKNVIVPNRISKISPSVNDFYEQELKM